MVFDLARGAVPSNTARIQFSRRRALRLATGAAIVTPAMATRRFTAASAASQKPIAGGDLVVAYNAEPPSLDPHFSPAFLTSRVCELVYNGLVRYNAAFEVESDLATGWTVSDDRLSYTFELHPGVVFHNGRSLTADDVVYSFERILTGSNTNRSALLGSVAAVTAAGERHVTFALNAPYAPFLANLATPGMYVVAKETVQQPGGLDRNAVGTGPFELVAWVAAEHLTLTRNSRYFESGLPYLDSITMQFVASESARVEDVRSAKAHVAVLRDPASADLMEQTPQVQIVRVPELNFHVIGLQTSQP